VSTDLPTGLPAWAAAVDGFDPSRWWCPIVCTGHSAHQVETLGLIFEPANEELHFGPRPPGTTGAVAWHIRHAVSLHRVEDDSVDATRLSITPVCPACDRTPLIPRDKWGHILATTRRVSPPWVDVSLYG
jgi:hypothetical protein